VFAVTIIFLNKNLVVGFGSARNLVGQIEKGIKHNVGQIEKGFKHNVGQIEKGFKHLQGQVDNVLVRPLNKEVQNAKTQLKEFIENPAQKIQKDLKHHSRQIEKIGNHHLSNVKAIINAAEDVAAFTIVEVAKELKNIKTKVTQEAIKMTKEMLDKAVNFLENEAKDLIISGILNTFPILKLARYAHIMKKLEEARARFERFKEWMKKMENDAKAKIADIQNELMAKAADILKPLQDTAMPKLNRIVTAIIKKIDEAKQCKAEIETKIAVIKNIRGTVVKIIVSGIQTVFDALLQALIL